MEKSSKNLGETKACPNCRNILLRYANFEGKGSLEIKCNHCSDMIKISFGQKQFNTTARVKIVLSILILVGAYQIFTLTNLKNAFMAMINENNIEVSK